MSSRSRKLVFQGALWTVLLFFGLFVAVIFAHGQSGTYTVREGGVGVHVHEVTALEPYEILRHMRSPIFLLPACALYVAGWAGIWFVTSKR